MLLLERPLMAQLLVDEARRTVAAQEREAASVATITALNRNLTLAQERGDIAAQLIIEGRLAAMKHKEV